MSRPKMSQKALLENDDVALTNAETQPEIASEMAELGYNSGKISEGRTILNNAKAAYNENKREDDETSVAFKIYKQKHDDIDKLYSLDRKKAKVVFDEDTAVMKKLKLTGRIPQSYIRWVDSVETLYNELRSEPELQAKVARLKITTERISQALTLIDELKAARKEYLREKGESQEATQKKDEAFGKLDDWMSEFFKVARIALEEKPQLLEALGKVVKN